MTKLKEFRTARGISQENLAVLVGVSRQTISKWENEIVQPSADNLMRLSQVLQLPLEAFLRDDWEPPEQQTVEATAILPETPQDTNNTEPAVTPAEAPSDADAEPAVTPAEAPSDADAEPAAIPAEAPPEPVDEVPLLCRRNYRLWAALAAVIAVAGIIAGVISFNGRGDDSVPISRLEQEEVEQVIIESATRQPLQP